MATYRKRGSRWYVEVARGGVRRGHTCNTKAEAVQWAAVMEQEAARIEGGRFMLHEAIDRYIAEECPKHRSRWEKNKLLKLKTELPNMLLADLSADDIARWRHTRLQVVSDSSVRREMGVLNQVLNTARLAWGWLTVNPAANVKRPTEHRARQRLIAQHEIDAIVLRLGYSDDTDVTLKKQQVAIIFLLAIETAMRAGEIVSLAWHQVDVNRRVVSLDKTKNGDLRDVPLSARAVFLFSKLPRTGTDCFAVDGASLSTLFRRARDAAGVVDLHFHDSRAEALTRLSKKLDVLQLARMVGHRDPRSLMIYYRETAEDMARLL